MPSMTNRDSVTAVNVLFHTGFTVSSSRDFLHPHPPSPTKTRIAEGHRGVLIDFLTAGDVRPAATRVSPSCRMHPEQPAMAVDA